MFYVSYAAVTWPTLQTNFKTLATCWKITGSLSPVRHWQKDWSTTRPWQIWICSAIRLALKGLRLGVWWGWWRSWGTGHERGGKKIWIQTPDRASRRWNGEMSERKTAQRIGAEMCQVYHSDLNEFELVLFISLETAWYVSMRGSMRSIL